MNRFTANRMLDRAKGGRDIPERRITEALRGTGDLRPYGETLRRQLEREEMANKLHDHEMGRISLNDADLKAYRAAVSAPKVAA